MSKILLALALLPTLPLLLPAGDAGFHAHFLGGTVPDLPPKSEGNIDLRDGQVLVLAAHNSTVRVPYRKIETIEYGQHVSRRYAAAVLISPLLLLSKSRKHFVTIGYVDEGGNRQAVVLQVGKGDVRAVLVGLEARTGHRVEYQDDEARRAGKG